MLFDHYFQAGAYFPSPVPATREQPVVVDRDWVVAWRRQQKESQRSFWARFGVTQSRGSRFEAGAEIPLPVSLLLGLYFSSAISDTDLDLARRVLHQQKTKRCISALENAAPSARDTFAG